MVKAKPKVLPALGGLNKYYLRKSKIIKRTLEFLSNKLDLIDKTCFITRDKEIIKKIKDDLIKLSKYEKKNKIEFYLECSDIITNY